MKLSRWMSEQSPMYNFDGLSYPMTSVLMNRGFHHLEAVESFLDVSLSGLHSPSLLPDLDLAVERIHAAVLGGELICIYGDYDVDGMTSVAILYHALKQMHASVETYIPARMEEGYGLNSEAIKAIAQSGAKLIITVDCGITAVEPAAVAKSLGVDLIITDHHECQPMLPEAYALINPKLPSAEYPFNMLAGAGIALKLSMALLGEDFFQISDKLLALSAIGTIADIAPLVDENRIIAKFGLEAITEFAQNDDFPGIKALLEVSQLTEKEITAGHVGFMIGPRLNAVGRLEHAKAGVDLLITADIEEARAIAMRLDQLNKERQDTEKKIVEEAIQAIETEAMHRSTGTIVVWGTDWHTGVVGIVASRLVEKYYRPAIVLSDQGTTLKGSARSIEGYSIFDALLAQAEWLEKFGGHEQAAGLTLKKENLPALLEGLSQYNSEHLTEAHLVKKIRCDAVVATRDVQMGLIEELSHLEPYGVGNPKPTFQMNNLRIDDVRRIGKHQEHIKLTLNDHFKIFEAMCFKYGDRPLPKKGLRADIAVQLELNSWQGVDSVQLQIKDIRSYAPGSSLFNQKLHAFYLTKLLSLLGAKQSEFDLSDCIRPQERSSDDTAIWLSHKEPLAVWSYEGLLELAYSIHDAGGDIWELLDGTIHVLPPLDKPIQTSYDLPLSAAHASGYSSISYRRLDHMYSPIWAEGLIFDRVSGSELFNRIKREGSLSLSALLLTSETCISDVSAIAFFIEAGFAHLEGDSLRLLPGPYLKVRFEDSSVAQHINDLTKTIQALTIYMKAYREL